MCFRPTWSVCTNRLSSFAVSNEAYSETVRTTEVNVLYFILTVILVVAYRTTRNHKVILTLVGGVHFSCSVYLSASSYHMIQ